MRLPLVVSLLPALASLTAAAPAYPQLTTDPALEARGIEVMSRYFNLLADQVAAYRSHRPAPDCDVSDARMPVAPIPLPAPDAGLVLRHVAVGRGTQNYTCDTANATAVPVSVGAMATLFNATCIAAAFPDLLRILPAVALQFDVGTTAAGAPAIGPSDVVVSGRHFFTAAGNPYFDLDGDGGAGGGGSAVCAKVNSTAAPADAAAGRAGEGAVPWLKLKALHETGGLREVYRVQTAGGSPPATCKGMAGSFDVQYAALYWFYDGAA